MSFIRTACAVLAVCGLIAVGPAKEPKPEHLVFCFTEAPPFVVKPEMGPPTGIYADFLDAITARIDGLTAEIQILPFPRCLAAAKAGKVDGILPLIHSPERAQFLTYSQSGLSLVLRFWYKPSRFPEGLGWSGEASALSHLRMSMLDGAQVDPDLVAQFERDGVVEVGPTPLSVFQMLRYDRVDVAAFPTLPGQFALDALGLTDEIVQVDPPIVTQEAFFTLSPATGADHWVAAFDSATDEMRQDGTLDAILNGS